MIDRLSAASEGLPLYVVEALAAGAWRPDDASRLGVGAVLRARLATAGETAGAGPRRGVGHRALVRPGHAPTCQRPDGGRDGRRARRALRRGLIREARRLRLRPRRLRDLAYEATSLTRRRLLHRRVAEALRLDLAGSGRDDLARLVLIAAHERDAGRDAEAAEAFRLAGERACRRLQRWHRSVLLRGGS